MKSTTAKQFLSVKGLPLMWWTLRRFKKAAPDAHLSVVLNPNLFDEFKDLEEKYGDSGADAIIPGGKRDSIQYFTVLQHFPMRE